LRPDTGHGPAPDLRLGLEPPWIIAIPKSSRADRIAENAEIFDFRLSRAEMEQLDDLGAARA